jgi:hypothetical protein
MTTQQEPDQEAVIEALARIQALSADCHSLIGRLYELDSEALQIGTNLRIGVFGYPPESDKAFEADPINAAVWARSEEIRGQTA